jgi:hypothetical protein
VWWVGLASLIGAGIFFLFKKDDRSLMQANHISCTPPISDHSFHLGRCGFDSLAFIADPTKGRSDAPNQSR